MKIAFCTLGCKVNQYETEAMRELFREKGYEIVKESESPDVFVLNSCTVTAESDRKTRQTLRHWRKEYPSCITVLCGCMSQAFPSEAEKMTEADIVFGNTDHKRIPQLVEQFLRENKRILAVEPHENGEKFRTPGINSFSERTRAYMKIEDGCNRFCSYCAIPYGRGRVRSKSISEIKSEAERLAQNGYCEIVLVGINLSAYGSDNGLTICDAVEAAGAPQGISRVRLGSLEPDHISNEILKRLFALSKFCPQFHLSLQSGCDATLKRMNRHYDTAFYTDLITRIRNINPSASITTDVMVGFVGETDEEFNLSLEYVKSCGFEKCHVFAYSKREGTAAAKLSGHIEKSVKQYRSERMIAVAEESHRHFLNSELGKTCTVLFEAYKNGITEGYTENYTRVRVKSDRSITGEIHGVVLKKIENDCIFGELV